MLEVEVEGIKAVILSLSGATARHSGVLPEHVAGIGPELRWRPCLGSVNNKSTANDARFYEPLEQAGLILDSEQSVLELSVDCIVASLGQNQDMFSRPRKIRTAGHCKCQSSEHWLPM